MHGLYGNTMSFYMRDLSILGFWYVAGALEGVVLEPISHGYQRMTII